LTFKEYFHKRSFDLQLLVVGSVALDTVKTPFGEAADVVGGSATYFSVSASYFTDVSLVGTVGTDFPQSQVDFLAGRGVDLDGLERVEGETFRWKGEYGYDLNEAKTLDTQLNVFADFRPKLPQKYTHCPYVFLANIDPELQLDVLEQVNNPRLVACDTMNFWIEGKLEALKATLSRVNMVIINEAEARELVQEPNVIIAARRILAWGPHTIIVKRGEYGAIMVTRDDIFFAPGYPLEFVYDPTGAGDTFAGGLMGYIASCDNPTPAVLRQAIVMGSVMASFNVEDFSLKRLSAVNYEEIRARFSEFKQLVYFEDLA
jgi:sugar/nucleoside kinase (ribokinase family)